MKKLNKKTIIILVVLLVVALVVLAVIFRDDITRHFSSFDIAKDGITGFTTVVNNGQ